MSRQNWQRDFDQLRAARPTVWGRWIRNDVAIVPAWLGRVIGDVSILFGRLLVSAKVAGAPTYARRFLLAVAWGRIVSGHFLATVGTVLCAGGMVLVAGVQGAEIIAAGIGGGCVVLLAWLGRRRRILESHAQAEQAIGPTGVGAGDRWLSRWTGSGNDAE